MKIIIISGRSGSGKSICLHLLEDLGFYCIDNLPAALIPTLIAHLKQNYQQIAIGIDARNLPRNVDQFHEIIDGFKNENIQCDIIYLDAQDDTLIKRFNETRRKHPLSNKSTSLAEAIRKEKELLAPIAHLADLKTDTTHYNIHQLRDVIKSRVAQNNEQMSLLFQSFGFKFGVPTDSDVVFDVRCLPNPYWHQELRPFTGKDQEIIKFLDNSEEADAMLDDLKAYLTKWIPKFEKGNRTYMTVSIGCTGGQHRSVYLVEKLNQLLKKQFQNIQIRHRELQ